jgi:signal transduction histidine kinase
VFKAVEDRVILYLKLNKDELLDNWKRKFIIASDDPYNDVVILNGAAMMDLVIAFLSNTIDEEGLRFLAYRIAHERLHANINIGEFVYNVCIGRSEIFNRLQDMGLTIEDLHPVIIKINFCFDKFLHFAVQHYTELKDKQLEEQSSFIEQTHKDRLTILGQMSASFVHEFRNPLTSIIGFVTLLKEKYPNLEYLNIMAKELDQLKFRIAQFLLVSKKETREQSKEYFQVAALCEETLEFLYPMIVNSDVLIETKIDQTLHLHGCREEFGQVLINLILNSVDALAACPEKMIHIQAYLENNCGILCISNNGPAISTDSISSIFEPFFSTKKLGTGIGLYICRKIIEKHRGHIQCESNEDLTTFKMVIPILKTGCTIK